MTKPHWRARNRIDLIIEVWETLDCESVGAKELGEIQRVVGERFGPGAIDSPASIARTLADEGAVLRHPEVLEADTQWRQTVLSGSQFIEIDISTFETVQNALENLDNLSSELQDATDSQPLAGAKAAVLSARQQALSIAKSARVDSSVKAEKREIAHWLTIWLQSPEMFQHWLDLRKRSTEFRRRFKVPTEHPHEN